MKQKITEERKDNNFASQIMIYFFLFCRGDVSKTTTSSESIVLDIPNVNGLDRQEK